LAGVDCGLEGNALARRTLVILIAWGVSLVGVGLWAQGRTDQVPRPALGHENTVLSGNDIGVRITGQQDANGRVPGTLVVKINGQWVDVANPVSVTPAVR